MKFLILFFFLVTPFSTLFSQHTFKAVIKDSKTKEILVGATAILMGTNNGASSDVNGIIKLENIPSGTQLIEFRYLGYELQKNTFNFPMSSPILVEIFLENEGEELEEVFVSSTRSSRSIESTPTRVESISGEELDEKGNMKPGDIRMLLNESTGIQTQQTSATSYNSSIRIQGLDGKYTQILRDGFPLYAGFSGGLSLLQIVPLDLKQVEVIKGASSTLYGGGAISGLVNLISKVPDEERELSFVLNGTSALGLDASGFYSKKNNSLGTTIFASYNLAKPYDPSNIGFTAIPKFNRYTINPKMFFYVNDKTTLTFGLNNTAEDRIGGDIQFIEGNGDLTHSYYEENKTNRLSSQFDATLILNEDRKLSLKNSLSYYDRSIQIPDYRFAGVQFASFSEINYLHKSSSMEWIAGLNLWTDQFSQQKIDSVQVVDYSFSTFGGFVQNTWNVSEKITLETGLRGDFHNEYGFFFLPRFSLLFNLNEKLSTRIGGGLGYKIPTVFTEDAERIQFRNVLPIDVANSKAEESFGGNLDINFKSPLSDDLFFSINTLFFYTRVNNPLVLVPNSTNSFQFVQPNGFLDTKGIETNIKLNYDHFILFIGYTFADVNQHTNGMTETLPLVAKHRLNNVLMYEIEDYLKIGLEAYYFSTQQLNDGTTGKAYWLSGLMIERLWEQFSIFINFENYLDTRQTKFDTIYTGTITNPTFRDIYAPVDGFVINGGLKLRF